GRLAFKHHPPEPTNRRRPGARPARLERRTASHESQALATEIWTMNASWIRSLKTRLSLPTAPRTRRRPGVRPLSLEWLEDRALPSTFSVINTNDTGPGSLRQAILDANANSGADMIRFAIPTSDANFVDVDSALAGGDAAPDAFVIQPTTTLPF